jgi:hypothetical protein
LYCPPNIGVIYKEHEMGTYATYAEVPYRVLVGKPEGKRIDGMPRLNGKKLKCNVSRMCVGWTNVA